MASAPEHLPDLSQPARPNRPLFERVQDLIFKLDVGYGVHWFRLGMFCLVTLAVILFYQGTQFYGFRDREPMNLGQLGRNLANGHGYVTKNIRPLDLAYLHNLGRPTFQPEHPDRTLPELWTPPVYPLVLSLWFRMLPPQVNLTAARTQMQVPAGQLPPVGLEHVGKLQGLYDAARAQALRMDRQMVFLAWVFYVIGLGVLYLLARTMFDHRVALMSAVLYLFCDPLLDACIGGAPTAWLALLFMLSVLGLLKAEEWAEAGKGPRWVLGALAASGLAVGLGTLTQYAFVSVLLPMLVYAGVTMPKWRWPIKLGVVLAVFLLVLTPWMLRNWAVSRTLFGLSRLTLTEIPPADLSDETMTTILQRNMQRDPVWRFRQMAVRAFMNWNRIYRDDLKSMGANFLWAFFLASLLHRYRREEVFRLRRYVFWSLLAAFFWLGIGGPPKRSFFNVFLPVVLIFGTAFFFVMFERLQFRTRWIRRGLVGLFAGINMLPFFFTLLPPAPYSPYPPYDSGVIAAVGDTFRPDDTVATDIPWAFAWYADRTGVLLPLTEADYLLINDERQAFAGIYMTPQTLLDLTVTQVVAGYHQFWLMKYQPPPPDAVLKYFRPLTPDGLQALTSNRPR
jgi:MFS family permease